MALEMFESVLEACGSAVADGIDQRPADGALVDRIGRQVQLQETHLALNVVSDRAGIDVRG